MAVINSKSFSMLFVAVILVCQNPNAATAKSLPGINPFCKTATHKQLCTRMVKGATNLHDATLNAINVAIDVAKRFDNINRALDGATASIDPKIKAQLVQDCSDSFTNIMDDLKLSIQLLNKGDMGGVGTRLSASFDSVCADSLKERGVSVPALEKLTGHFAKVMDNALAVAFQS